MAKLLSIQETAKQLGVCADTVRRLIRTREIAAVRIARRVLVPSEECERAAQQGLGDYARSARAQ